jgi:hypothetical protein
MQALKRITCPGSEQRYHKILNVASLFQPKSDKEVGGNKRLQAINEELRTWNMEINPSMLQLRGLVLPKPKLQFGNNLIQQPNDRGMDLTTQHRTTQHNAKKSPVLTSRF